MKLLCLGDVALIKDFSPGQKWSSPLAHNEDHDYRILFNMELPLGSCKNPLPRSSGERYISDAAILDKIKSWSPGFACLATNHILDSCEDGLEKTIQLLNREGFTTIGAGLSTEQIQKPLVWETSSGCLTVINWVFPETHPDWMRVPGPNCWPGMESAREIIQNTKNGSDWVVAVVHWSDEDFPYPSPEDRDIAQALITAGANLIIGHHPHVVRGMEYIASCPVFYSLGNYYFSDMPADSSKDLWRWAPRNREGLGVLITLERNQKPVCHPISFWQEGDQTILDRSRRAERRLKQTSWPLTSMHNLNYLQWYAARKRAFERFGSRWHFGVRRLGFFGTLKTAIQKIIEKTTPEN